VADAAAALSVIQSRSFDGRDAATGGVPLGWRNRFTRPTSIPTDYTKFLDPNGLKGAKIGISRAGLGGFGPPGFPTFVSTPPNVLAAFQAAVDAIKAAGATVIELPDSALTPAFGELLVLLFDFRRDLAHYIAETPRTGVPIKTLDDAIAFNNAHAAVEMPFFSQDIFLEAATLAPGENDPQSGDPLGLGLDFGGLTYAQALDLDQAAGVSMDDVLAKNGLDAIVSATDNPAWANDFIYGDHFLFGTSGLAAGPGYPIVQVPAGNVFGVPLGISFFGTAFSEGKLIKLASGFEAVTQARQKNLPQLLQSIPDSPLPEPDLVVPGHGEDASARRGSVRRPEQREHHHM
jgi:amidase